MGVPPSNQNMASLGKGSTALEADTSGQRRSMSTSHQQAPSRLKFPDFHPNDEALMTDDEDMSRDASPRPLPNGLPNLHSSDRWNAARKDSAARRTWTSWAEGRIGVTRHSRQKSLSEAIRTVRTRKASISESTREIADSLKAPVSFKLVVRPCPNFDPIHALVVLITSSRRSVDSGT